MMMLHRRAGHHRPAGHGAEGHRRQGRSYTGGQVKVLTDSTFTKARILSIDEANMRRDLDAGTVVVVAGFQGVDETATSPRSAVAVPIPPAWRWRPR
jgi:hypothetical protein